MVCKYVFIYNLFNINNTILYYIVHIPKIFLMKKNSLHLHMIILNGYHFFTL